ncbi:MAG: hypothetical protein HZB31_05775 [Nitrospirae bacterium]|nr:hypothetical protein [Nitrospirota bacterium]
MNVIRSVLQEELTGNSREAKIEQIDGQAQVVFSGILTIEHASQMKETLHNVLTGMEEELVN